MEMMEQILLHQREREREMNGRLYASCVRSIIIYGSETMPLPANAGLKFERVEIHMMRWMCCVSMKDDGKTNEELIKLVGVEPITTVIRSGRL